MMKKLFLLAILMLVAGTSFSETIILQSGDTIEGKIVERNDDFIKVDNGTGIEVTYYLDEIGSINEGTVEVTGSLSSSSNAAENRLRKESKHVLQMLPDVEYSAIEIYKTPDVGEGPGKYPGMIKRTKVYYTPEKQKRETSVDGGPVTEIKIIRFDKGLKWGLIPDLKVCFETPLSEDPLMGRSDYAGVDIRADLGEEIVNGIKATKYKVVSKSSGNSGGEHEWFLWESEDGIIVKMVFPNDAPINQGKMEPTTLELKDLKRGPQDSSLFELPDGYTVENIPAETIIERDQYSEEYSPMPSEYVEFSYGPEHEPEDGTVPEKFQIDDHIFKIYVRNVSPNRGTKDIFNHKGGPYVLDLYLLETSHPGVSLTIHSLVVKVPSENLETVVISPEYKTNTYDFPVQENEELNRAYRKMRLPEKIIQPKFKEGQELFVEIDCSLNKDGQRIRRTIKRKYTGYLHQLKDSYSIFSPV